jgi:hypothetical protein
MHSEEMSQKKSERPAMADYSAIELNAVESSSQYYWAEQDPARERGGDPTLF